VDPCQTSPGQPISSQGKLVANITSAPVPFQFAQVATAHRNMAQQSQSHAAIPPRTLEHMPTKQTLEELDSRDVCFDLLSPEAVRIDVSVEAHSSSNPSEETKILEEYRKMLDVRSGFHFGYPYNLNYTHEELLAFMRYSINNLGDPWVESNYAVHSRPFELAVIDFFAQLWKIEKPNYWYVFQICCLS